jgi:predicted ArsR family transcriptional regulator
VKIPGWRRRILASTRGKILALLRNGSHSVNELAETLGLTDNAVRSHLTSLERDGLVQEAGTRPGIRKPHILYGPGKTVNQRIEVALNALKGLGGDATVQEKEGKRFILGNGCPLSAATAQHPEACLIVEALLSEIIGIPVKECCHHGEAPRCCFDIS